ncbi:Holliday junction resolvase RecU [Ureaplasma miroungigenitalium]|uniref:Holliday junction resolvase RecU n=1 Tax=Ureaplasma miroungigenitalium TaxID=1042321 RepID=A0ABT3BMA4_9BACT|nr:Holliday junction resolvase RecU [Ureaplasma miroungigenitalium]MCV3728365.1 Holliday junction resolvase RecU [Ureaplasma miroungigenitalium]MCV3734152.1 Holliday junction resolvase RecU [Ureaplasma miroungigenitalium]
MWVKNKGMFLETLINRSLQLFTQEYSGFFIKRDVSVSIRKIENNHVLGTLKAKSQADYYGFYDGSYYDFEVKQTTDSTFDLKQIKDHQLQHLLLIHEQRGYAFVIIGFLSLNKYYAISIFLLYQHFLQKKEKRIHHEWLDSFGISMELIFPGLFNWLSLLKSLKRHITWL